MSHDIYLETIVDGNPIRVVDNIHYTSNTDPMFKETIREPFGEFLNNKKAADIIEKLYECIVDMERRPGYYCVKFPSCIVMDWY